MRRIYRVADVDYDSLREASKAFGEPLFCTYQDKPPYNGDGVIETDDGRVVGTSYVLPSPFNTREEH